jgi:hypothetical protein
LIGSIGDFLPNPLPDPFVGWHIIADIIASQR